MSTLAQTRTSDISFEDVTLNTLVAQYPAALSVLQRFGLDTCCGGALPLRTAAEHHQLDLAELVHALRAEIDG
jgi:regulator of cell morphogenesis and NO signaling